MQAMCRAGKTACKMQCDFLFSSVSANDILEESLRVC